MDAIQIQGDELGIVDRGLNYVKTLRGVVRPDEHVVITIESQGIQVKATWLPNGEEEPIVTIHKPPPF